MKLLLSLLLGCAALSAFTAQAQTSYRWTDPKTGQMVISDKPPPAGVKQVSKYQQGPGEDQDNSNLPYATRKAVENYPVKLYTAPECVEVCQRARDILNTRGVPFTEKLVTTPDDSTELKNIAGEVYIPVLTVGKQVVKGVNASSWNNILDLAGYPKTAPYGTKPSGGLPK